MKMYLISDNIDTWTGMRLAGVEGVVVHEKKELKEALDKVLTDREIGIVLLTEKFGKDYPDLVNEVKLNHTRCLWRFRTATEPVASRTLSLPM